MILLLLSVLGKISLNWKVSYNSSNSSRKLIEKYSRRSFSNPENLLDFQKLCQTSWNSIRLLYNLSDLMKNLLDIRKLCQTSGNYSRLPANILTFRKNPLEFLKLCQTSENSSRLPENLLDFQIISQTSENFVKLPESQLNFKKSVKLL